MTCIMFFIPVFPYNESMAQYTSKQLQDLKVLAKFVRIYCAAHHDGQGAVEIAGELTGTFAKELVLCSDCRALFEHALLKRRNCPLEPKPTCRDCHIHCYSTEFRAKIREIMAFSGRKMILHGRLDYLWHYFF